MLQKIIHEIEHELDRSKLYGDPPSKELFERLAYGWSRYLHFVADEIEAHCAEQVKTATFEQETEIRELREAIADLEERVRQVKEIL